MHLPHCVGLVTDLSPHLVRRALTSLRAEIHYREHLFNRKKAKDLIELETRGDPECPPALVLVIDEFAALAGEIPEFVDGVVDIAQRGRSLGIHLIMATQRPAGVIKDNLRANTNLRIALRMADEADSVDVIGQPIAAHFDPSLPGRGIAKAGPGRITPFQTGYAGGWTSADSEQSKPVLVADLSLGSPQIWESMRPKAKKTENTGPNDTTRLVQTLVNGASLAEIPAPRRPWLDELSEIYDLAKLPQRSDERLLLSVCDDPERQEQYPVYFEPDNEGNVGIFGAGGSGKTTALRSLAISAAITPRGGPVHVYGIDFGGSGLRMLEVLPHVGSIISGDDEERVSRLFSDLKDLVDERVDRYAKVSASTIGEYRRFAGQPDEPRILLLLDGMANFRQEYEYSASPVVFSRFQQLLSDGRKVGLHIAVTADRPGSVSPSVLAGLQKRVVLRQADENDYMVLDQPGGVLGSASPAGRALIDGLENQIVVFGGSAQSHDQTAAIEALATSMEARGVRRPAAVKRLDSLIPLSELGDAGPGRIMLGMADDTLEPVSMSADGAFMVVGPPLSGRTTLLLTLAAGIERGMPHAAAYYFGSARSPLSRLPLWRHTATSNEAAGELARELQEAASQEATPSSRLVVMIESIADYLSTGVDNDLVTLVKSLKRNGHLVIAESETSTWTQSWPLLMEFKSGRRGFVLQPEFSDGDLLFKTSLPRSRRADFPPGRGFLIEAGKARKVQIAYPAE